ncbi:MAG TPA: hypothetical protein VIY48_13015 [Candidatus Paceibacterota bacterium]
MFITVVAVLCRLAGAATGGCFEEIVTDSNMTPDLTMISCAVGAQGPLAKWKEENYPTWSVERYKCIPGHYSPKHQV